MNIVNIVNNWIGCTNIENYVKEEFHLSFILLVKGPHIMDDIQSTCTIAFTAQCIAICTDNF